MNREYFNYLNQSFADRDGMSFAKDSTKPIGGNIIGKSWVLLLIVAVDIYE